MSLISSPFSVDVPAYCLMHPLETLPPRRSEWGSNLAPDCFVSRGSISRMYFVTKVFYGEELLTPRPTPKLEDHPMSAVRDCLFNIFAVTLHIEGRSSIRNPRMRHTVVTGAHLSHGVREIRGRIRAKNMSCRCCRKQWTRCGMLFVNFCCYSRCEKTDVVQHW
jgi:hypothetical protein